MRLVAIVLLSATMGCSYPDFAFATDAPAPGDSLVDTAVAPDDTTNDTAGGDAIFPTDDTSATDTTTVDSVVVVDTAMPDTVVPPMDTAPKTGCAALPAMFCRDFDSAALPTSGWVDSNLKNGGTIGFETGVHKSPGQSLKSTLPIATTEVSASIHTSFTASTELRPMYLDFWVRFKTVPTTPSGPLVAKLSRGGSRGLALYVGDSTLGLDAMGPSGTVGHRLTRTILANAWIHIRIEGVLSPTTSGSFKWWVDDKLEYSKPSIPTTNATGTDVKLSIGLYNADPNPTSVEAYFDDVQFDWL